MATSIAAGTLQYGGAVLPNYIDVSIFGSSNTTIGLSNRVAQSVYLTAGKTYTGISLLLYQSSTPDGNVDVTIRDSRDGTILATSSIAASSLTTGALSWERLDFSASYSPSSSGTYWVQIQRSSTTVGTVGVGYSSSNVYASGNEWYYSTSWISQPAYDTALRLYTEKPSAYAVFVNSSGDLAIWEDIDGTPSSLTTQTPTTIFGGGAIAWLDAAIDSNGDIHVIAAPATDQTRDITYNKYTIGSGWGTWTEVAAYQESDTPGCSIDIGLSDVVHVAYLIHWKNKGSATYDVRYNNDSGTPWANEATVSTGTDSSLLSCTPYITAMRDLDQQVVGYDNSSNSFYKSATSGTWGPAYSVSPDGATNYTPTRITMVSDVVKHYFLAADLGFHTQFIGFIDENIDSSVRYSLNQPTATVTASSATDQDSRLAFFVDSSTQDIEYATVSGTTWTYGDVLDSDQNFLHVKTAYHHDIEFTSSIPLIADNGTNVYYIEFSLGNQGALDKTLGTLTLSATGELDIEGIAGPSATSDNFGYETGTGQLIDTSHLGMTFTVGDSGKKYLLTGFNLYLDVTASLTAELSLQLRTAVNTPTSVIATRSLVGATSDQFYSLIFDEPVLFDGNTQYFIYVYKNTTSGTSYITRTASDIVANSALYSGSTATTLTAYFSGAYDLSGYITYEPAPAITLDALTLAATGEFVGPNEGTLDTTLDALTAAGTAELDISATLDKSLDTLTLAAVGELDIDATLSKTLDALTLSAVATNKELVEGTADITLGALTCNAAAELDISATLARTLDDLTAAGAGELDISATLARTLEALTLSATAELDITSTLSSTLDALALAATGSLDIDGSLSRTLEALTLAATGEHTITGSLTKTLDALAAAGTAELDISATLTKTLDALTASGTAELDISATASITLDALTVAGVGELYIAATLSKLLDALTLSATGETQAEIFGTADITLDDLTASGIAELDIAGALAKTLEELTLSSSASLDITATLTKTLESLALAGTSTLGSTGALSVTLEELTAAGTAELDIQATANVNLASLTLTSTGELDINATASILLSALTLSASAELDIAGVLTRTLEALALAGTATVGSTGSLSATLDALTAAGAAELDIQAVADITLGALLLAASGELDIDAAAAITLAALTFASTGELDITGALTKTLDALTLTATGTSASVGSANITLDTLTAAGSAELDIAGTLAKTLDALVLSSTAELDISGALAKLLDALTLASTGELDIDSNADITLGELTLAATGTSASTGSLSVTLDNLTCAATGQLDIDGAANITLGALTVAATAELDIDSAAAITLEPLTLTAQGSIIITGAATITLAILALSGYGLHTGGETALASTVKGPSGVSTVKGSSGVSIVRG